MFVYLSKLLPLFIFPLGLASLFIILALIVNKRKRLQRGLMIVSLIILWLAGNRWVSYGLARSLEWRNLPLQNIPAADAIVLLGGGTEPGDPPRSMVEVNSAGDRVLYAAYLYQQGAAPVILVSGGNLGYVSARNSTPAEDMTELLILMGVPESAIWQQPDSQNTYEDALYLSLIHIFQPSEEGILIHVAIGGHQGQLHSIDRHLRDHHQNGPVIPHPHGSQVRHVARLPVGPADLQVQSRRGQVVEDLPDPVAPFGRFLDLLSINGRNVHPTHLDRCLLYTSRCV